MEHSNGKRLTLKVESKKKLGAIGAQVRALVRARLCAMLRIPFRHATVATQDRAVMEKKTQLKLSSARVRCAQPTNPLPLSWRSTHIAVPSTHP